jgi:YfiH family protein
MGINSDKKVFKKILFSETVLNSAAITDDQPPYFCFSILSKQRRLVHGVFTRHGGSSRAPYDTLNMGYNTGDDPEKVRQNLETIKNVLQAKQLLFMNQIHKDGIKVLRHDNPVNIDKIPEADAIITDMRDVAIMIKQADCQGIILFDPAQMILSVVHCGWRGNQCNILGTVIERMGSVFGCDPSDIIAAIGPSLGPCCAEFVTHKEIFPESFNKFMVRENFFDLWELSRYQLIDAGLKSQNIEIVGICTKCSHDIFFSYRAARITGRFATAAMLL